MTRFFFWRDYGYPLCCLCGDVNRANLEYCGTCDEHFCPRDVNRWDLRAQAMAIKKTRHARARMQTHAHALREALRVHLS